MVSPAVITIVPGVKPLNQTTPPGARGAPTVTPPTFTSWLVAAKLREEEKTKITKIATDAIATSLSTLIPGLFTNRTTSGGIALLYLSVNEKTSCNSRPVVRPTSGAHPGVGRDLSKGQIDCARYDVA